MRFQFHVFTACYPLRNMLDEHILRLHFQLNCFRLFPLKHINRHKPNYCWHVWIASGTQQPLTHAGGGVKLLKRTIYGNGTEETFTRRRQETWKYYQLSRREWSVREYILRSIVPSAIMIAHAHGWVVPSICPQSSLDTVTVVGFVGLPSTACDFSDQEL